MQVDVETTSSLERRLTIGVPADRVENEILARLQKASKTVRLSGFRPGKIPMKVMKQRFGSSVRQEVLGEVMNQSFQEAVIQENLRPAGSPSIEPKNLESGRDLEYVATFEVIPEITIKDIDTFDLEKPVTNITDEDVDQIIEVFRKQHGIWNATSRPASNGDRLNIDYKGTIDGDDFEGGSRDSFDIEIGSESMIPGFENGLIGCSAKEEITLSLRFPDDYHQKDLQARDVTFAVVVNDVKELEPATVDEKLFTAYGLKDGDEEAFRKEISGNMERESKAAIKARVKQQVMDMVIDKYDVLEIPSALINQEIQAQRSRMFQNIGGQLDQNINLNEILPDQMFSEMAEKRVKLALILNEYIQDFKLAADGQIVRETIEELASTYEQPEDVVNWYYSNQEQLASIESQVVEDQLVDRFLEKAIIKEIPCTYKEVLSLAQQNG
ncbi:MAG: trigger factor [Halieaceae bacterium]|nr:trigger factor [Halieaceae bacterium]